MPVSSVQNSERIGCSWGWTYVWNSDSISPVDVFNRTAGNSTVTETERGKQGSKEGNQPTPKPGRLEPFTAVTLLAVTGG